MALLRRHAGYLLASAVLTAGAVACSLNPQPLPPDTVTDAGAPPATIPSGGAGDAGNDHIGNGPDASSPATDSGAIFGDASAPDAVPPPPPPGDAADAPGDAEPPEGGDAETADAPATPDADQAEAGGD
jgi:hypothetical protein